MEIKLKYDKEASGEEGTTMMRLYYYDAISCFEVVVSQHNVYSDFLGLCKEIQDKTGLILNEKETFFKTLNESVYQLENRIIKKFRQGLNGEECYYVKW